MDGSKSPSPAGWRGPPALAPTFGRRAYNAMFKGYIREDREWGGRWYLFKLWVKGKGAANLRKHELRYGQQKENRNKRHTHSRS